jgi:hypothetical protein
MPSEPQQRSERAAYTVIAERMAAEAWHITVRELPATWTVAFARADLEQRSRERIALDLGCHPADFDVRVLELIPPRN